ncbi:hypothetical protein [Pseudarthrobacter sp. S3]|uniref:hypothetical protein n=1 Tax=unclassified Pseudarthrobacter TaxID=2647000 RepID=UPI003CEB0334
MNVKDLKTNTKIVIVSAGVLGMAGLGLGAANAATPAPTTTQSVTADTPSAGDTADTPGAVDTPTPGDTADTPGAVDTPTPGDTADAPGAVEGTEAADAPEAPGDSGPNIEQTGDHTDPGDAPGSP